MEKNVSIREEEVLLVNGTPITLEGEEGLAIKVRLIFTCYTGTLFSMCFILKVVSAFLKIRILNKYS